MALVTGILSLSAFNMNSKFVQEAEIKHGRTAMLAMPTLLSLEVLDHSTLGINQLASTPIENQACLLGIFGCSEVSQMLKAYEYPSTVDAWFNMKDSHIPGDYNFDPLNISNSKNIDTLKTNEKFIGRVAMLSSFVFICDELVTGTPSF